MRGHALSFKQLFGILLAGFIALFVISAASAWAGPTTTPPNGNVSAPINVGTTNQVKNAGIGVNSLAVFGDELIQTSGHLNFGSTSGDSGYGIRDLNGLMEYKNSTSTNWIAFNSIGSSSSGATTTGQLFTYSSPGTYTWNKPSTGTLAILQCWGGGGGGGTYGGSPNGGGGGGGYVTKTMLLSQLPSSVTVTIGAGGVGGIGGASSPTYNGTAGGTSSFGSYVSAYGGGGAVGGAGGAGGTGAGGTAETGGVGGVYTGGAGSTSCAGAGGAGGSPGSQNTAGPGTSGCGGNGGAFGATTNTNGSPGSVPGGGGGGANYVSKVGTAGGTGASGECIVTVS